MSFRGRLSLTAFFVGADEEDPEQAVLQCDAAYLGPEGDYHGSVEFVENTRNLPPALRSQLLDVQTAIEAHLRSIHFYEEHEDVPQQSGTQRPQGLAEVLHGRDDSESFEQGGG